MELKRLDLQPKPKRSKLKKKFVKRLMMIFFAVVFVLLIGLIWAVFNTTKDVLHFSGLTDQLKQTNGRTNVLLLGIGGGNHEGSLLTDSIIVASYDHKSNKLTMFSIPRDLWIAPMKDKVNAIYEYPELKQKGSGLTYAEQQIGQIMGIPIHYGVVVDFDGFSKAIDLVGGVEVKVPNTFDDYMYPKGDEYINDTCGLIPKQVNLEATTAALLNMSPGVKTVLTKPDGSIATQDADFACRYMHVHFNKGTTVMDGTTALEFVRSRHALGVEGSDFARSKRQQLVIEAFRSKALSLETLSSPSKITGLVSTFGQSIQTDIPANHYYDFYKMAKDQSNSQSIVLGQLDDGTSLLVNPSPADYGGAWVLIPQNNDFKILQNYVQKVLTQQPASPSPSAKLKQ